MNALDQGFKAVIHNSDILSWLIRSSVDELKGKSIEEIKSCLKIGKDGRTVIGRENEIDSPKNGKIVTDSVFDIRVPGTDREISIIVNIEGQNDPHPRYPLEKRAEYYAARLVSSQKGTDFVNDDYSRLRKVYSIWYVLRPRSGYRNTAVRYGMEAEILAGNPVNIPVMDTFNIVMIYVGSYDDSLPDESAFPAALFSQMNEEERHDVMKDRFNIEFDDFLDREVNRMASLGEDTYNHGFREGKAEGRAESDIIAIEAATQTIIRLVKDERWPLDKAMSTVVIPDELKEKVETEVRKRL